MTFQLKTFVPRATLVVAAFSATLLVASASHAEDAATGAGLRVYRDPATGAFTTPPTVTGTADALSTDARARETAPGTLVEERGSSAAGGVTMNLQGRFAAEESATVDANGAVHTHCGRAEAR